MVNKYRAIVSSRLNRQKAYAFIEIDSRNMITGEYWVLRLQDWQLCLFLFLSTMTLSYFIQATIWFSRFLKNKYSNKTKKEDDTNKNISKDKGSDSDSDVRGFLNFIVHGMKGGKTRNENENENENNNFVPAKINKYDEKSWGFNYRLDQFLDQCIRRDSVYEIVHERLKETIRRVTELYPENKFLEGSKNFILFSVPALTLLTVIYEKEIAFIFRASAERQIMRWIEVQTKSRFSLALALLLSIISGLVVTVPIPKSFPCWLTGSLLSRVLAKTTVVLLSGAYAIYVSHGFDCKAFLRRVDWVYIQGQGYQYYLDGLPTPDSNKMYLLGDNSLIEDPKKSKILIPKDEECTTMVPYIKQDKFDMKNYNHIEEEYIPAEIVNEKLIAGEEFEVNPRGEIVKPKKETKLTNQKLVIKKTKKVNTKPNLKNEMSCGRSYDEIDPQQVKILTKDDIKREDPSEIREKAQKYEDRFERTNKKNKN